LADLLTTVSTGGLADRLGELSHTDLQQVARAIKIQLALEP